MGYFQDPIDDPDPERRQLWQAVIDDQIKKWPEPHQKRLADLEHHLEAKALYMLSLARRTIMYMVSAPGTQVHHWKAFYPQAYSLLFPIIEMFGKAVWPTGRPYKEEGGVSKSNQFVGFGLMWLYNPSNLRPANLSFADDDKEHIQFLIRIRNYLLHGMSQLKDDDIKKMDASEPYKIALQLEKSMRIYWNALCHDSDNDGWVHRLSNARIYPFFIPGSRHELEYHYEKALIDSEIVDYLNDKRHSILSENNC